MIAQGFKDKTMQGSLVTDIVTMLGLGAEWCIMV